MEEPVTIVDRNVLRVLSVDTRMDILKELSSGDRTPSDLSKRLKKSNPTIVEHLEVLRKAGLVKKIEQPGKKWIFYTLTERGEGIIKSKSRKLVVILSTSLLSGLAGLVGFGRYFWEKGTFVPPVMERISAPAAGIKGVDQVMVYTQSDWMFYLSLVLITVSATTSLVYLAIRRNYNQGVKHDA